MVSSNPRPAMLESAHIYTTGGPNAQIASAANQRNLCHFLCRSVHSDDSEVPIQPFAQSTSNSAPAAKDQNLIDAYRHVEVASVSDALEQLTGRRMYMSHKMQPIFPAKFAGFALTVKLQKDEGNRDPAALNGMLAAIDQGALNSVWVMVVEDGVNIAGMGGLMGTAMSSRGYSGAVIDGGVRDLGQLRKIGFPVFALGVVPSTSVHH